MDAASRPPNFCQGVSPMATQMKAVIVPKVKAAWELQDRPVPEPGPAEVLVRIRACGICGTDLWVAHGDLSFREFPPLMGHEGVGEVVPSVRASPNARSEIA